MLAVPTVNFNAEVLDNMLGAVTIYKSHLKGIFMSQLEVAHEELPGLISTFDQTIFNHQQWFSSLIRTLICHLPTDQHDICTKAHKECRFGQWYYNHSPKSLHAHPGFIAIGKEHQHMHQLAKELLVANENSTISSYAYDNFANSLEKLRLEIFTLKRELEDLLYNCDPLTRAVNRVNMLPILREQQESIKRDTHSCCIVMIDLDNFKKINDTHGHLVGDTVLTHCARFIKDNIRPYEKFFRYGGEEFLICLQNTELTSAYKIIERIRKGLANSSINIDNGKKIHITASFGVTLLDPNLPVEESIDRADKAMYQAKSLGRNRTQVWDQSM